MPTPLQELEKAIFKLNNPEALFIPADILELIENPPDPFCYWDLDEDERENYISGYTCLCKKCLMNEFEDGRCWWRFDLSEVYNSAFID